MPAEAFLHTGERAILPYLVKPIGDQIARSFARSNPVYEADCANIGRGQIRNALPEIHPCAGCAEAGEGQRLRSVTPASRRVTRF
jgi:hypothetical protein